MTELTASELRMLAVVQENHVTNVELAERLGMAPSPCLRRMKALKDQGYIERTVSILDRRKLGFEILAQVEIKVMQIPGRAVDEEFRKAVAREIGAWAIEQIYRLFGTEDHKEGVASYLEKRAPVWTGR